MNRNDFMRQLESLLQNIASNEREEALQYYNDYFDDAGKENEQEVIEALGNPARVAESIRKDLLGNGYGDGPARKALASDRTLMEYGKDTRGEDVQSETKESGRGVEGASAENVQDGSGFQNGNGFQNGSGPFAGFGSDEHNAMEGMPPYQQDQNMQDWGQDIYEKPKKGSGMPTWAVALLVTLLVLCSPVLLGLAMSVLGVLLGVFFAWFGLIFAFGAVSLCMLAVLAVLVIMGVMCAPVNPWVGMALIGSGLICGAIGILFLMLTVAVGSAVPAAFRGLFSLFRRKKRARG